MIVMSTELDATVESSVDSVEELGTIRFLVPSPVDVSVSALSAACEEASPEACSDAVSDTAPSVQVLPHAVRRLAASAADSAAANSFFFIIFLLSICSICCRPHCRFEYPASDIANAAARPDWNRFYVPFRLRIIPIFQKQNAGLLFHTLLTPARKLRICRKHIMFSAREMIRSVFIMNSARCVIVRDRHPVSLDIRIGNRNC